VSVAVVVKVSEGLVLGADSAATIRGRREGPQGIQEGVLKTYFNARKLLQIGKFPIGVLTWGAAFIGPRTIESLVREFEYERKWQDDLVRGARFQVRECAEELCKYLSGIHAEEFGDQAESHSIVGVIVAGYSGGGFAPEIWRFVLPFDSGGQIHDQRPDVDGKPSFGASWFGQTDAIVRLHFGRDNRAIGVISEKFGIPADQVSEALQPLEYQIPFFVMPLQDAIEYANYVLSVATGRYRFMVGPELCGGAIEIAVITPEEFKWVSRKTLSL
jgi:hypothetical protein